MDFFIRTDPTSWIWAIGLIQLARSRLLRTAFDLDLGIALYCMNVLRIFFSDLGIKLNFLLYLYNNYDFRRFHND